MIDRVLQLVAQRGWFDIRPPFDKVIGLSQAHSHYLSLGRGSGLEVFIKFSDSLDLRQEARNCEMAAMVFSAIAPRFIGYARQGDLNLLATEAVAFDPLTIELLRTPRRREWLDAQLSAYLRRASAAATAGARIPQDHGWFASMVEYFASHPTPAAVPDMIASLRSELAGLPEIIQHGDFTINNLGLRADGGFCVFDWEDLGATPLPGLDLFTIEMSMAQILQDRGYQNADRRVRSMLDISRHCDAIGLSLSRYDKLKPLYALTFRYLKRNYGPQSRSRADALVRRVLRAPP